MSNYTIPRDGAVNLYFDTQPSTVADQENTLHAYILNNIPGHDVVRSAQGIEPNNDLQAPSCKNVYDHCVKGENDATGAQVVSTPLHVESLTVKDSDSGDTTLHVNNDGELTAKKVATKTAEHLIENLTVKVLCDAILAEAGEPKEWTLPQTSNNVNFIHSGGEPQTIAGTLEVGTLTAPTVTATETVSGATVSGTTITATGTVTGQIVSATNHLKADTWKSATAQRTINFNINGNANHTYYIPANYTDSANAEMDLLHTGILPQTKAGQLTAGTLVTNAGIAVKGTSTGATITSSTNATQRTYNLPTTTNATVDVLHTGGETQQKSGGITAAGLTTTSSASIRTTNGATITCATNASQRTWNLPATNENVDFLHTGTGTQQKNGNLIVSQLHIMPGGYATVIQAATSPTGNYSVTIPVLNNGGGNFVLTGGVANQTIGVPTTFSNSLAVAAATPLSVPTNGYLSLGGYSFYNPTIGTTTATKIAGSPAGYPTTLNLVYVQKTLIGQNNVPATAMVYERDIYHSGDSFAVTGPIVSSDNAIYQIDQDWLRVSSFGGTIAQGSEKIAILTDQQTGGRMVMFSDGTVPNRRVRFSITAIQLGTNFSIQKFKITDYFVQ